MQIIQRIFSLVLVLWIGLGGLPLPAWAIGPTANYMPDLDLDVNNKDYAGQILYDKRFTKLDLEGANFRGADLTGSVFNSTDLTRADLRDVNFKDGMAYHTTLQGADLTNAVFTNAFLLQSILEGAIVDNVDFTNAILDLDQKLKLCQYARGKNPLTGADTRRSLGCGPTGS